jgi:hypothetical protein
VASPFAFRSERPEGSQLLHNCWEKRFPQAIGGQILADAYCRPKRPTHES